MALAMSTSRMADSELVMRSRILSVVETLCSRRLWKAAMLLRSEMTASSVAGAIDAAARSDLFYWFIGVGSVHHEIAVHFPEVSIVVDTWLCHKSLA